MSPFRLALLPFLLSVVQAGTPDNVSSRLMIHVSFYSKKYGIKKKKIALIVCRVRRKQYLILREFRRQNASFCPILNSFGLGLFLTLTLFFADDKSPNFSHTL